MEGDPVLSNAITVRAVETLEGFRELELHWNELLRKSHVDNPFLTFQWQSSWWEHFGGDKRLLILVVSERSAGRIIAIVPLMMERIQGCRILKFIGTGLSDILDFIIPERTEEVIVAVMKHLKEERRDWDLILLSDILQDRQYIECLQRAAVTQGMGANQRLYTVLPYLCTNGSWDQFLSKKSSSFRYTLRRRENKLRRDKKDLMISRLARIDVATFEDLKEIEAASWKSAARTAKMQTAVERRFFLDVLKKLASIGWLDIWLAKLGEQPAAYLINFSYAGKIWFYNGAYTEDLSAYAVGAVLHQHAIKNAFETRQLEYDFLRGDEEYKSHWTELKKSSYQVLIYKKTVLSFAGAVAYKTRWLLAKYSWIKELRVGIVLILKKWSDRRGKE